MIIAVILAAALLAYLALCAFNRAAALAVFCALLPAYVLRFTLPIPLLGALPTTLLELMFIELLLAWIFLERDKSRALAALGRYSYPIALIFIGATIGVLVSPDMRAAVGLWRAYFAEPMLFFLIFATVARDEKRRDYAVAALGVSLAFVGLSAIYQKMTGFGIPNPAWQAAATRRVTSVYGFPNAIGLYAAPIIVIMTGRAIRLFETKGARAKSFATLMAISAALGLAAIFFAVSEGAMIGTAAGLLVLGLFHKRLRLAALAAVIAACGVFSFYRPATDYAGNLIGLRDDSGSVRKIIWGETAAMLSDHPVFGAGLAGYRQIVAPYDRASYIEIFMYPHNIFLNFWSEIGLLGAFGFIILLAQFFIQNMRLRQAILGAWLPPTLFAAMITVLIHGLVDVPYFKNDLAFLFWIIIGFNESLAQETLRPKTLLQKATKKIAGVFTRV